MANGAGARTAREVFPNGFAAIDGRLFEPVMCVLSDAVLRVYLAAIDQCRGRPDFLTSTRDLGDVAKVDQARVSVALHKLEGLHLVACQRSAQGTYVEILEGEDISEALEALEARAKTGQKETATRPRPPREKPPVVQPSEPADASVWHVLSFLEAFYRDAYLGLLAPPTPAAPPPGAEPGVMRSAPLAAEAPDALDAPAVSQPPAEAPLEAQNPQKPPSSSDALAGEALSASPSEALSASPLYYQDRFQDHPSLPSLSAEVVASQGGMDVVQAGPASERYSEPPSQGPETERPAEERPEAKPRRSQRPGKERPAKEKRPRGRGRRGAEGAQERPTKTSLAAAVAFAQPAPDGLDEAAGLACDSWEELHPTQARRLLWRMVGMVSIPQLPPSGDELSAFVRWVASQQRFERAVMPLAVAVSDGCFVRWLKDHRAEQTRRAAWEQKRAERASQAEQATGSALAPRPPKLASTMSPEERSANEADWEERGRFFRKTLAATRGTVVPRPSFGKAPEGTG